MKHKILLRNSLINCPWEISKIFLKLDVSPLGSFVYFDNIYQYSYFWIVIINTFFLNTWEEYYIGELFLPIIHGVSEGMLLIAALEIISGIYGPSVFLKKVHILSYDVQINNLIGITGIGAGIIFGLVSIVKVCRFLGKRFMEGIKTCAIQVLLLSSYLSIIFIGDKESYIVQNCPKLVVLTYGILFAKVMGILQLAHLKGSEFNPLYFTIVFPLYTLLAHSVLFYFGIELISINYLIPFFFAWNVISWAHFVYYCSEEMCEILNIHRFVLGKRHKE